MEEKIITRLQVLEKAKEYMLEENYMSGICLAIHEALEYYGIIEACDYVQYRKLKDYIPLFTFRKAINFGANPQMQNDYWWTPGYLDTGRMDFINWLIEQYHDDDTNLMAIHAHNVLF